MKVWSQMMSWGCINILRKMNKNESTNLIRQVMTTEVKWVIGIIVFVAGVIAPYYEIRQDVALIQKDIETINVNHLKHIEDIVQTQKEQQTQILEMQKQLWAVINR